MKVELLLLIIFVSFSLNFFKTFFYWRLINLWFKVVILFFFYWVIFVYLIILNCLTILIYLFAASFPILTFYLQSKLKTYLFLPLWIWFLVVWVLMIFFLNNVIICYNLKCGWLFYLHFYIIWKFVTSLEKKQILSILKSNCYIFRFRINKNIVFVLAIRTICIQSVGISKICESNALALTINAILIIIVIFFLFIRLIENIFDVFDIKVHLFLSNLLNIDY